jgi:hypothetical protein
MLRFAESFNTHLGVTEMGRRYSVFTSSTGITTSDQVTSAVGTFLLVRSGLVLVTKALVGSVTNTWITGLRMKLAGKITAGATFTAGSSFYSGVDQQVGWSLIRIDDYRYSLVVKRGATTLATVGPYFYDKEHYIEFKALVRTSTNGAYELKVDGVSVASASGVNTANAGTDGADRASASWANSGGPQIAIGDWIVLDDASPAPTDFVGPVMVLGGVATADGTTLDWTPSAVGAHFSKVNEGPGAFNDSTFVASETIGDIDTYVYNPAGFVIFGDGTTIIGIDLTTTAGMQASGDADLKGRYRDPSTTESDFGDSANIDSTAQRSVEHIAVENPVTTSPWTMDDILDGEFGPTRV